MIEGIIRKIMGKVNEKRIKKISNGIKFFNTLSNEEYYQLGLLSYDYSFSKNDLTKAMDLAHLLSILNKIEQIIDLPKYEFMKSEKDTYPEKNSYQIILYSFYLYKNREKFKVI